MQQILISNLKNDLTAGSIQLIRSDNENCIYKKFQVPKTHYLYLQKFEYIKPSYYNYSYGREHNNYNDIPTVKYDYILKVDRIDYNRNYGPQVELIIDQPMNGKLIYADSKDYGAPSLHKIMEVAGLRISNQVAYTWYHDTARLGAFSEIKLVDNFSATNKVPFLLYIDGLEYDAIPDITHVKDIAHLYSLFFSHYPQPAEKDLDKLKILFESANFPTKMDLLPKGSGVFKTLKRISPLYEQITNKTKLAYLGLNAFINNTQYTKDGIKVATAFNAIFEKIKTADELEKILNDLGDIYTKGTYKFAEAVINTIPEAKELKKAALKKKATGAFNKKMADLDFVEIDEAKYPITHKAVFDGELPIGTFFRKEDDTYFLYNDNWALWEEFLSRFPQEAVELAKEASRRSTYEKDLMSYFYFILRTLPKYLEKHTNTAWTCSPKLVKSANELEPPTVGSNGVAKTRSALTPIVDNEKAHVVVPYVSMAVGGRATQYCYALDYNVLQTGMSYKGNVVTDELEVKLNGQDDYGLLFYTLTGTDTARGYPTFLVIFERLDE
jgi:hypothetical protein